MINEIADPIDGIEPGAVGILILQNEIQVSFGSLPVVVIRKRLEKRWLAERRDKQRR